MGSLGNACTDMSWGCFDFIIFAWNPFILPTGFTVWTKTSSAVLNRHGESGHPCLAHDFSGNTLVLLYVEWSWLLVYCILPSVCWNMSPVSLHYLRLPSWRDIDLSFAFFCNNKIIIGFCQKNDKYLKRYIFNLIAVLHSITLHQNVTQYPPYV